MNTYRVSQLILATSKSTNRPHGFSFSPPPLPSPHTSISHLLYILSAHVLSSSCTSFSDIDFSISVPIHRNHGCCNKVTGHMIGRLIAPHSPMPWGIYPPQPGCPWDFPRAEPVHGVANTCTSCEACQRWKHTVLSEPEVPRSTS